MFYKHLHDPSCDLFMHGEEAPQSKEAQLQAALDAERANRLAMEACVDRDVKAIKDLKAQLATLQAQLRQVEGERDAHAQDVDDLIDCCINDVLVTHATPGGKPHDPDPQIRPLRDKIAGSLVELQTLRQLVEAFVQHFDDDFENPGLELYGRVNGKEICEGGKALNELLAKARATLLSAAGKQMEVK